MPNTQKLLQSAQQDLRQKAYLEASEKAYAVIKSDPLNSVAWHILGLSSMQQNNYQEAVGFLRKAVQGEPRALYYFNLAIALKRVGQLNESIEAYQNCLKLDSKMVRAWSNLGNAYRAQDRNREAERCYQKAIDLEPSNALAHFNLGILYHIQDRVDDAIKAYRRTIKYDPKHALAYSHLGVLYSKLQRFQKSLHYFEKAIELDPYLFESYQYYGGALIEVGRLEEAEMQLRKALKLNPKSTQTLRYITLCKRYNDPNDNDAQYILKLLESPHLTPEDKIHLDFALGKIYHESKEYEKAFSYFRKGNELHYKKNPFNIYALQDYIEDIKQVFDDAFMLTHKNLSDPSVRPLLILGHPRSGKTLLQKMLSSHPDLAACGEVGLSEFASTAITAEGSQAYPAWVRSLDKNHAQAVVTGYENRLLTDVAAKKYCMDTMPGNIFYLGLFVVLFPNLKIIAIDRHEEDLAVMMYFKYFVNRHFYSYDLKTLGQYLKLYDAMMAHWQSSMGDQIHQVKYEDLVLKPEETLSGIFNYLQVEPIDIVPEGSIEPSEIGVAKHYFNELKPLREGLGFDPASNAERIRQVLYEATQKHQQEQFDEAAKLYRYVLQLEPKNAVATHLLGVVAFEQGQPQEAIKQIEKAIELNPEYAQAHQNLAAIYQQQNNQAKSAHHLHIAQQLFKASDVEKFKSLSAEQSSRLKSAFVREFSLMGQFEKKMLFQGETDHPPGPAHDPGFCKDLSYGSYRTGGTADHPIDHSQAWHFVFKQLKLVETMYRHPSSMFHLLDVECGVATLRRFIEGNASMNESKEIYYWGMDAQKEKLEKALNAVTYIESGAAGNFCPTAYLLHDSALGLPFIDEFFDMVVYFNKLQYLSLKSGVQCLHEMSRVLKPDGMMVISLNLKQKQPGTLGGMGFDKIMEILNSQGIELIETLGTSVPVQTLFSHIKADHQPLVQPLLRVHAPELVAALLSPLYPDLAETKVMVLKKQQSELE